LVGWINLNCCYVGAIAISLGLKTAGKITGCFKGFTMSYSAIIFANGETVSKGIDRIYLNKCSVNTIAIFVGFKSRGKATGRFKFFAVL
jgi:hypothetical protein